MTARAGIRREEAGAQLLVERRGAVAWLTLNRPAARNALSRELLERLDEELSRIDGDRALRAAVVAANGPVFSSGHDLRQLETSSPGEVERIFGLCSTVMQRLPALGKPVIARVHGLATAAGCQLVAACDLAVAAKGARFATPGVKIGLFCSTPAVPVVRAVGRKRALEMLLTGESIDARTALAWGLVNRVVPASQLDDAIEQLLAPVLAASARAIALGKRTFYRQLQLCDGEAYEVASAAMCENASGEDAREGIEAFLAKRPPVWKHR